MKRKSRIIVSFVICVLIAVIVKSYIKIIINDIIPTEKIKIHKLTTEEKIEDFNTLYNTMINGNPSIFDYKELYDFNIKDRKKEYLKQVKQTKNNFEYFCFLDAFCQEIPSFHTGLEYPDKENYFSLKCYGSKVIQGQREILGKAKYWDDLLKKYAKKYKHSSYYSFEYIDGIYYLYTDVFSNIKAEYLKLNKINDINVDDFIKNNLMISNLYYDFKNHKPCRTRIIFNSKYGNPVKIDVTDQAGSIYTKNVYYSICEEECYYNIDINDIEEKDFYSRDIKDCKYIKINTIDDNTGKKFFNVCKKDDCKKIILDLRDNWGGYSTSIQQYYYPIMGNKKIIDKQKWIMPLYGNSLKAYDSFIDKFRFNMRKIKSKSSNDVECVICEEDKKYVYSDQRTKDFVILVSHYTGSAADELVNIVKRANKKIVIIGENTGGEGLSGTFACQTCKNTGLVFTYMPSKSYKDKTNNSLCGTKPDYYVSNSIDYYLRQDDKDKKIDDVIKYAINVLKKKKKIKL